MNYKILMVTQIMQNLWWIVGSVLLTFDMVLVILSCVCITSRLLLLVLSNYTKNLLLIVLSQLLINICYTEASFRIPMENYLNNYVCTVIAILFYIESNLKKNRWIMISKFGYPLYGFARFLSFAFINDDYYNLESTVIIGIIIVSFIGENLNKKASSFQSSHDMSSRKFMTFNNEESKKASIANNFKHSRTHYSIQKEPIEEFNCQNPILIRQTDHIIQHNDSPRLTSKLNRNKKSKQLSILSITDKQDYQLNTFYQNLLNIIPQGILFLNSNQKVLYMNNKCEKLLECKGQESVMQQLKTGLANCELENENLAAKGIGKRTQMSQQVFEEMAKQFRKNGIEFDVFDVLLNPGQYIERLTNLLNTSPYSEQERYSSKSDSFNGTQAQGSNVIVYTLSLNSEKNGVNTVKKIKVIIIISQMTLIQQEQFSIPSQQRVRLTKCNNETQVQPVLLFMIKDLKNKLKIQQLKKEQEVHTLLIRSFSHELRTPLNSSYTQLSILKDKIKGFKEAEEIVDIIYSSNSLLMHQINDILDYAAMQSNQFKYKFCNFYIEEIKTEINNLYVIQMKSKKIGFDMKIQKDLLNYEIRSDKERIIQVLVNLLNNSCKFTKEGGKIKVSIKQTDDQLIKISVKDNGIGITTGQLQSLKRSVMSRSIKSSLSRSKIRKHTGLGIDISSRIVEGLTECPDPAKRQLDIQSNEYQGTAITFYIENIQNTREDSIINPMQSEYTKHPTFFRSKSQLNKQDDNLPYMRQLSDRSSSNNVNNVQKKRNSLKSKFYLNNLTSEQVEMNDNEQFQISKLPTSPNYSFKSKFYPNFKTFDVSCDCTKVLIVDDIPFNQMALKAMLIHHKINPDQAYDGFQAIDLVKKKLETHCQYYYLIFMDIEMPGISGFQATKEIIKIVGNRTNIVCCSSYDTLENYQEGSKCGMVDFLPKPIHQKELERILYKYLFPRQ